MFDNTKELVLHSIGSGYFETVTGKFTEIMKGQDFKADIKCTLVDIEGGDSLFPIYTFISKREGTIELTNAVFSLSQVSASTPVDYVSTGLKKATRVLIKNTDTTLGTGYTGVTNVKVIDPSGNKLADSLVVSTGTAPTNGVSISATGAVSFDAGAAAGEYKIWFDSDAATESNSVQCLKNAMPEVSSMVWHLPCEELDGDKYSITIRVKRCRADGNFTIDAKRGTASAPKISAKILDPGDGSNDFMSIVVSKIS